LPALIEKGAIVRAHDPQGMQEAKHLLPESVHYCDDILSTVEGADAVVLMTEWNAYRAMKLADIKQKMSGNVFIDLRNVYEPSQMLKVGFNYFVLDDNKGAVNL